MRVYQILVSLLTLSISDAAVINPRGLPKRDVQTVQEDITVVKEVQVIEHQDGSLTTATPVIVNTIHATSTPAPIPPVNEPLSLPIDPQSPQAPTPKSFEQVPDTVSDQKTDDEESVPHDPHPEITQEPPKADPVAQEPPKADPVSQEPPKADSVAQEPPSVDPIQESPNFESVLPDSNKADSSIHSIAPLKNEALAKSSHSGKRGIAYNDPTKLNAFTSSSQVSWAYNWGHTATKIPGNMEFVPMLWGSGSHSTGWHEAANKALEQGCTHFLAFNEPDLGEQSSLTVGQAVEGYRAQMQPFAGRAKLGSPAVTNGGTPMGLAYLTEFITQCTGCTIDFVAIHWYNGGTANDFKNHVLKAHLCSGKPVWVTEFQGPGDAAQQQAFLHEVIPWLDRQIYVERYAYFMASDGNLISSGTTLSPVGQAFAFTT